MQTTHRAAISFGTLLFLVAGLAVTGYAVFRLAGGSVGPKVELVGDSSLSGDAKTHPAAFKPAYTLTEAATQTAASGKPVLLFFTAEWCGPCQSLKGGALSDGVVAAAVQAKTIPVFLDCSENMPALGEALAIKGYPTLLLVKNGKEVARITGGTSAGSLVAWLDKNAS